MSKKHIRVLLLLSLLVIALLFVYKKFELTTPGPLQSGVTVRVIKVLDGDTIVVEGGKKIRYIGIDTPEIDEPFYEEAKARNYRLVGNRVVKLEFCREEPLDKYGRMLSWVHVNDMLVNAELLKDGLATALIIPPCGEEKEKMLKELERKAMIDRIGLWALPDTVIDYTDALSYIGEEKIVRGRILSTYNSGKAVFLNFGEDFKRDFTVVIFQKDLEKFTERDIDPERYYLNKEVLVRGRIEEYNGPEIVATSPSQIDIVR